MTRLGVDEQRWSSGTLFLRRILWRPQNKTVLFFLFELYIYYYQFVHALCLVLPSWELVSVAVQAVIHNRG